MALPFEADDIVWESPAPVLTSHYKQCHHKQCHHQHSATKFQQKQKKGKKKLRSNRKNCLGLPTILRENNAVKKLPKNPSIRYQFYENNFDPQSTPLELEDAPYYSLANIYDAQLKNKKSRVTRTNKIIEFLTWLEDRRTRGLYGPTAEELKNTKDKSQFFQIIEYYFEYRFNITYNKANSFATD